MKLFDNGYVEDDVEYRIWPFISKCFDLTEIRAFDRMYLYIFEYEL